jgi:hypothetical protein
LLQRPIEAFVTPFYASLIPFMAKAAKPSQEEVLESLTRLLRPYEKKLVNKSKKPKSLELYSNREIEVQGKKHSEIFFAGVIPQKEFVGFYFMPIYTHAREFADLKPELRKLLKGKSCFRIRTVDPVTNDHIKELVKKGFDLYKKIGWV